MRDPQRIPLLLARLQKAWETVPDWRLCQLVLNATGDDPFYVEDEQFILIVEALLPPPPDTRENG